METNFGICTGLGFLVQDELVLRTPDAHASALRTGRATRPQRGQRPDKTPQVALPPSLPWSAFIKNVCFQ
eukprot:1152238-Amphidinium_carterae.1